MRTLILLLMAVAPGVAEDSIALVKLKKAAGRETVMIRLATGEEFSSRLRKVDINGRTLTFGTRRQPRAVACSTINTLAFEPRDRRRRRTRLYSAFANATIPVAIVLLVSGSTFGIATAPLLWPGGIAWGWPLSHGLIERKTEAFPIDCR